MRKAKTRNIGRSEQLLRIAVGAALAFWALWRIIGGGSPAQLLLDFALAALGVDFVVTGIRGHCPLYRWLGWSTARW